MSLNIIPLPTVSVIDPRLNYNREKVFTVLKGARIVNVQNYVAQTPIGSSLTFNITTPSRDVAVSRKFLMQCSFTFTVTGANTSGGTLLRPNFVAPRAYPTLRVGDSNVSQSTYNTYSPQLKMFKQTPGDEQFRELSIAPVYPDQSMDYSQTANSLRNPLGVYNDSVYGLPVTRGGFAGFAIAAQTPGNTTATCTLTCTEELDISPFIFGKGSDDEYAFVGIDAMNFTFAMDLVSRTLSVQANQGVAGGLINITGVTTVINNAALFITYITPQANIPRPMLLPVPYANVTRYQTQGPVVTPGQQFQLVANNIQFNSIPRMIFAFGARGDSTRSSLQTDAVFPVSNANAYAGQPPLTITWDNNPGYFTTYSAMDLFEMTRKSGYQGDWTMWSQTMGSIIAIDLGAGDMGLDILQSPSLTGNFNIQLTLNLQNNFLDTQVQSVLNIIAVYDGVFNIVDGQSSTTASILSRGDINAARVNNHVSAFKESISVTGGSFLSNIVQGAKSLLPGPIRSAIDVGQSVYCNKTARKLLCPDEEEGGSLVSGGCGLGNCKCEACKGAARSGGRRRGGAKSGGRMMSKRELERRLM